MSGARSSNDDPFVPIDIRKSTRFALKSKVASEQCGSYDEYLRKFLGLPS